VQSTGSDSLPPVLPSSTANDEAVSDDKTPVVQNHDKHSSDSGSGDVSTKDKTSKDVTAENTTQSAKKKGKGSINKLKGLQSFPGWSLSRKDVSRVVVFPDETISYD